MDIRWFQSHAKFVVTVVTAIVAGAAGIFDDGHISGVVEWTTLATAIAAAVNVYVTPDLEAGVGRISKGLTTLVFALAGAITPALLVGGIDPGEWLMLLSVAAGALGALGIPNIGYLFARKTGHVR